MIIEINKGSKILEILLHNINTCFLNDNGPLHQNLSLKLVVIHF